MPVWRFVIEFEVLYEFSSTLSLFGGRERQIFIYKMFSFQLLCFSLVALHRFALFSHLVDCVFFQEFLFWLPFFQCKKTNFDFSFWWVLAVLFSFLVIGKGLWILWFSGRREVFLFPRSLNFVLLSFPLHTATLICTLLTPFPKVSAQFYQNSFSSGSSCFVWSCQTVNNDHAN